MEEEQYIFISLDDSGKLSEKEEFCLYAGFVCTNYSEKSKLKHSYRKLLKTILQNSRYNNFTELKGNNAFPNDRKRLIKLINKNSNKIGLTIDNTKVYPYIFNSSSAKGRYRDFAIKLLIKNVLLKLIQDKIINPLSPIKLDILMDQETTKSNGYYNLKDSINEEFINGINNFNYGIKFEPIIKNSLKINIKYSNSKENYLTQVADFIANDFYKQIKKNGKIIHDNSYLILKMP